jgi:hypothetical protein
VRISAGPICAEPCSTVPTSHSACSSVLASTVFRSIKPSSLEPTYEAFQELKQQVQVG